MYSCFFVFLGPSDKTALQELVTEALAMRRVGSDQNIIKLLGVCTRGGKFFPFLAQLRQYCMNQWQGHCGW
jgi:hypothetical protein